MGTPLINRLATKRRIVDDLARVTPDDIEVTYGPPIVGGTIARESLWLGDIKGTVTVPNQRANRKDRDDEFTITAWASTADHGKTCADAEARAVEIYSYLEDYLAEDHTLGGHVAGLLWAIPTGILNVGSAPTGDGWTAVVEATITCKSRLS